MDLVERTSERVRAHPVFYVGPFLLVVGVLTWRSIREGEWLLPAAVGFVGLIMAAQFLLEVLDRYGDG